VKVAQMSWHDSGNGTIVVYGAE